MPAAAFVCMVDKFLIRFKIIGLLRIPQVQDTLLSNSAAVADIKLL